MREEGKQAAKEMISVIEGSDDDGVKHQLTDAYFALGQFSEADGTTDGYDTALQCFEKVRDYYKSEGHEREAASFDAIMKMIKFKRDGGERKFFTNDEHVKMMRHTYEAIVKEHGEDSSDAIKTGIVLAKALWTSARNGLERERLANKLETTACEFTAQTTK